MRNMFMRRACVCLFLVSLPPLFGQTTASKSGEPVPNQQAYAKLGAGDQISVWARDAEEISGRTYRVDDDGDIRFPLVGSIKAAGLSVKELEFALLDKLKPLLLEPDVHVLVTEFRSQPVSVQGAVHQPGILQIRDRTTLVQVLSMVGGLANDAGQTVKITRRKEYGNIPLPGAQLDPAEEFYVATADLNDVLEGAGAAANVAIRPNDVISVDRAEVVYVVGEVKRAGGFALGRKEKHLSALQALARAEGLTPDAAPKKALILRPEPGAKQTPLEIDLKKVMAGQAEDLQLKDNDILFVPKNGNHGKTIALMAAQTAAALVVGVTVIRAGQTH